MKKQIYRFNFLLKRGFLIWTLTLALYAQLGAQDFNVTPFVFNGASYNVGSFESSPTGLAFSKDGLRMFIVGSNGDRVNQFNLTTAFDLTTASFDFSFSISAEETASSGIAFSGDGLRMFVTGGDGKEVNQYDLTTSFDVRTASFTPSENNPFDVSGQEFFPRAVTFSSDGLKMFIIGVSGRDVNQYDLTTAFDVTTASFTASTNNPFDIEGQETFPTGLTFSNNGFKMFVIGQSGDDVNQYNLTVPFDITTASFDALFSVAQEEPNVQGITFSEDGLRMFIVSTTSEEVTQYDLATAFDVTTAFVPKVLDVTDQTDIPGALTFSNDGLRLYIGGGTEIFQYDLTTAFELSTPTNVDLFSVASESSSIHSIDFSSDGLKMFTIDSGDDEINQYDLSTAFDVKTASFTASTNNPFDISIQGTSPTGLIFSNDGLKMFTTDVSNDEVSQYDLSTAFDITTASFTTAISIFRQESSPQGIDFSLDGLHMFVIGDTGDEVNQYDLTVAFDLSTATFTETENNPFSVKRSFTSRPSDITFSSNGEKMFVVDGFDDRITQYDLFVDTERPEIEANQSFSYVENQIDDFEIGVVIAIDNLGVTSFSITAGDEDGFFAINETGILTLTATGVAGASNDFELGDNNFSLSITGSDAAGNESAASTISIEVSDVDDTAPVIDAGQSFTYKENQEIGFTIGRVTATDNVGVTNFSITAGNEDGFFAIDNEGNFTLTELVVDGAANDFETGDNSFTLSIIASDEAGNESMVSDVTIEVSDVDEESPVVTANQTFSYEENQPIGFEIGTVVATDNVGVVDFTILAGNDEGFFAIDGSGEITLTEAGSLGVANDFETIENNFTLSIVAFDGSGNESAAVTITIEISDIDDEAPMIDPMYYTYAENQLSDFEIGAIAAIDNVSVVSFSINSENEEGFFAIDDSGLITLTEAGSLGAANDFETGDNIFTVSVIAIDASGNQSIATDITIEVTDVDDTSPVIAAGQNYSYPEGQLSGFVIGTLTATDNLGVANFSILSGNDDDFFTINETGILTLTSTGAGGAANDFLLGDNNFTLGIVASDAAGNQSEAASIVIEVLEVDEESPVVAANQSFTYEENQTSGFEIGTVVATDNVGVVDFTIPAGNDEGFFAIDGSGVITLTEAGSLGASNDFETSENNFTLSIAAFDGSGNESAISDITIEVSDVDDEAPEAIFIQTFSYRENQESGFVIATVTATDNVGVTGFSIINRNEDGFFAIDNEGNLSLTDGGVIGVANDFETGDNTFVFSVVVNDAVGNESRAITVTMLLVDVDDTPPVVDAGQNFTYVENQASGFEIGTVTATDNVGVKSFSITAGNEEGFFGIDIDGNVSLTGVGIAGAANDFETGANSFTLGIVAIDEVGNESRAIDVTLEVIATDEDAPVVDTDQSFTYEENQEIGFVVGTVAATDNVRVTGFAITAGDELGFMAIDGSGVITLTTIGVSGEVNDFEDGSNTFSINVTAVDEAGNESEEVSITISVTNLDESPVITNALADVAYIEQETINYSIPSNAFSDPEGDALSYTALLAADSELPAWLSFEASSQTFNGVPSSEDVGIYAIIITATDQSDNSVSDEFTLTVLGLPTVANPIPDISVSVGETLSYTVPASTFSDTDGDEFSLEATQVDETALPLWLSFDSDSGTFSGTPASEDVGLITVKLTATDQDGLTVEDAFEIEVLEQVLSVKTLESVEIYPNPTKDLLQVTSKEEITVYLTDLNGKRLTESMKGKALHINLQSFNEGVYLLQVLDEAGTYSQKIIREN